MAVGSGRLCDQDDREALKSDTRKRGPRRLLRALLWVGRLTAAEMHAHRASQRRLGELLLGTITTSDVDYAESLFWWQWDIDELRWWPLPFW